MRLRTWIIFGAGYVWGAWAGRDRLLELADRARDLVGSDVVQDYLQRAQTAAVAGATGGSDEEPEDLDEDEEDYEEEDEEPADVEEERDEDEELDEERVEDEEPEEPAEEGDRKPQRARTRSQTRRRAPGRTRR